MFQLEIIINVEKLIQVISYRFLKHTVCTKIARIFWFGSLFFMYLCCDAEKGSCRPYFQCLLHCRAMFLAWWVTFIRNIHVLQSSRASDRKVIFFTHGCTKKLLCSLILTGLSHSNSRFIFAILKAVSRINKAHDGIVTMLERIRGTVCRHACLLRSDVHPTGESLRKKPISSELQANYESFAERLIFQIMSRAWSTLWWLGGAQAAQTVATFAY